MTSTFTPSSTTFTETLVDINESQNDLNNPTIFERQREIFNQSHVDEGDRANASVTGDLESKRAKEIFDNDVLGSEEIQQRSPTTAFVGSTEMKNQRYRKEFSESLRRVAVPVKILDDTDGEELSELVLLRIPESKLNSAILNPVFRVKVLEQIEGEKEDTGKYEISGVGSDTSYGDVSSENYLIDDRKRFSRRRRVKINSAQPSSTFVDTKNEMNENENPIHLSNGPRKRQRIVKARRRTGVVDIPAKTSDEKVTNEDDNQRTVMVQVLKQNSRRRERVDEELPVITTPTTESSTEPLAPIEATTLRGNLSISSKSSNLPRGFYITKSIDETSLIPVSTTTDSFVETTQYSTATTYDVSDQTTLSANIATRNDETVTTPIDAIYETNEELSTYQTFGTTFAVPETTSRISNVFDTFEDLWNFTQETFKTTNPDYISISVDVSTESSNAFVPITPEKESTEEPPITTIRPVGTSEKPRTNPTIFIESTTPESPADTTIYKSRNLNESRDLMEIIKTSANNHYGPSVNLKIENTTEHILKSEIVTEKSTTKKSTTPGSPVDTTIYKSRKVNESPDLMDLLKTSDHNHYRPSLNLHVENTTEQIVKSEVLTEKSTSSNINEKAKTHRGRGRYRYTTSPKSIVNDKSSTREDSRSKVNFVDEASTNNLLPRENLISITSTTEAYSTNIEPIGTTLEADYLSTDILGTTALNTLGTLLPEDSSIMISTTENYDKIKATTEPMITTTDRDNNEKEENKTKPSENSETTVSYTETTKPFPYITGSLENYKTESITVLNDPMLDSKFENSVSTTEAYPTTDYTESTKTTDENDYRIVTEPVLETTTTYLPTKREDQSIFNNQSNSTTTPSSTIYDKPYEISTTPTKMITNKSTTESVAEKSSPISKIETLSKYEKKFASAINSSTTTVAPVTQLRTRTRGRVRFTNFAGNNDETGENVRPVKQVVVRRRPATESKKNIYQSNDTHESNFPTESKRASDTDVNSVSRKILEDNKTRDITVGNEQLSEEKNNSLMRRRVVVYRGRPRAESFTTSTTTTTTTMQSLSASNDEIPADSSRTKRRKWRKRLVTKRAKTETEDDQSIAETGDVLRAIIHDEVDNFGNDRELVTFSKHEDEDIDGEVSYRQSKQIGITKSRLVTFRNAAATSDSANFTRLD